MTVILITGYEGHKRGQFFDIWNMKLSSGQIFNYVANANNPLNVYINETKVQDGTNYRYQVTRT
jgi:hypothetical protein